MGKYITIQLAVLVLLASVAQAGPPPGNDECSNAFCIAEGETVMGTTLGSTPSSGGDISSCALDDTFDVWYAYTPINSGSVTIETCGSSFDTTLAVFQGCPDQGGFEIRCDDDSLCAPNERITENMFGGFTCHIRVSGFNGGTGDFQLLVQGGAGICELSPNDIELVFTTDEDTIIDNINPADHEIVATDRMGGWSNDLPALTGALPDNVHINAIDYLTRESIYFSLEETALIGGNVYADEDIIHWNGSSFSQAWDGSANGLPEQAELNALDVVAASPLEFSFSVDADVILTVGGSPTHVADEDVVHYVDGTGFTTLDFDGSASFIPAGVDLNGFNRRTDNEWLMTFNRPVQLGLFSFVDDADVVEWFVNTSSYNLVHYFVRSSQGVPDNVDITGIEATDGQVNPAGTPTPSPTATASASASPSNTNTPTVTNTGAPTATNTLTPTSTGTATATDPLPPTKTPQNTATNTSVPTVTNTGAATATSTLVPTVTNTGAATATNTQIPTVTNTPAITATPTAIFTIAPCVQNNVDFTGDGKSDANDVIEMLRQFYGLPPRFGIVADVDCDNDVDPDDIFLYQVLSAVK